MYVASPWANSISNCLGKCEIVNPSSNFILTDLELNYLNILDLVMRKYQYAI